MTWFLRLCYLHPLKKLKGKHVCISATVSFSAYLFQIMLEYHFISLHVKKVAEALTVTEIRSFKHEPLFFLIWGGGGGGAALKARNYN